MKVTCDSFSVMEDRCKPLCSHGVYTLRVSRPTTEAGHAADQWTIRRRFRSFLYLHDALYEEEADGDIAPPAKLLRPLLDANVEARKADLASFLNDHLALERQRIVQRVAYEKATGEYAPVKSHMMLPRHTPKDVMVDNLLLQAFLAPPILIVHDAAPSTRLNGVYVRRSATSFVALSGDAAEPRAISDSAPAIAAAAAVAAGGSDGADDVGIKSERDSILSTSAEEEVARVSSYASNPNAIGDPNECFIYILI